MKDKRHLVQNRKRRERRRHRLRKVVSGTPERPRLVVHRSLRHIEVQLVDDVAGFLYHGIVKAVADGAREAGLNF